MSDFIWNIATSSPVLCVVASALLAALVVGHFPLLKYFPVIGPYVPIARLVALLMFGLLAFLVGFRISDERDAMKNLKAEIEAKTIDLNATVDAEKEANDAKTALVAQAAKDQERIEGYEQALKSRPVGDCILTDDDRRWMRHAPSGRKP